MSRKVSHNTQAALTASRGTAGAAMAAPAPVDPASEQPGHGGQKPRAHRMVTCIPPHREFLYDLRSEERGQFLCIGGGSQPDVQFYRYNEHMNTSTGEKSEFYQYLESTYLCVGEDVKGLMTKSALRAHPLNLTAVLVGQCPGADTLERMFAILLGLQAANVPAFDIRQVHVRGDLVVVVRRSDFRRLVAVSQGPVVGDVGGVWVAATQEAAQLLKVEYGRGISGQGTGGDTLPLPPALKYPHCAFPRGVPRHPIDFQEARKVAQCAPRRAANAMDIIE